MTLLVSLPVHENVDVVINQLQNLCKFLNNPYVILHVNKRFVNSCNELFIYCKNVNNVFINPINYDTERYNIIQAHLSNFDYAFNILNLDFSHMIIHASNDMYVGNAYDYITNNICGLSKWPTTGLQWTPKFKSQFDYQLQNFMKKNDIKDLIGCHCEGSFYEKFLFNEIYKIIMSEFDLNGIKKYYNKGDSNNTFYAREELYFSTIANKLCSNIVYSHLYSEIETLNIISKDLVNKIVTKTLDINKCYSHKINKHILYDPKHLYAVKRVPRKMNHSLRIYINQLK